MLRKNNANEKKDLLASFKTRSFRVGGYSVAATALVLAIAIATNFFVNTLPSTWTQIDTSSQQLFSISEQTHEIIDGLDEEVQLYWVVQSGAEDSNLSNLLDKYDGLSDKITVTKKDPNVNPTFINQYVSGGVYNNSVIAVCGERSRYVEYDEIFVYDVSNYYYDGTYSIDFHGEDAITSAIAYVISETLPKIYSLNGHGESAISESFSTALSKENMDMEELSLLTSEQVPEDASCLLINAPQSDISSEETELIRNYLSNGGKLFYISDPAQTKGQFSNLESLMADYGLSTTEGIVVEGNANNYFIQGPLYLLPNLKSHAITDPLIDGGYYVMLPIAHGISTDENLAENLTAVDLLTSSYSSYSKVAGYDLSTMEKEEGDLDGPFTLATAVSNSENESSVIWVSSMFLLDDGVNQQVSGGNQDFFLNALAWLCNYEDNITIHSKSLNTEYLTIPNNTATILSIIVVGIIPILYLSVGIYTTVKRRRS